MTLKLVSRTELADAFLKACDGAKLIAPGAGHSMVARGDRVSLLMEFLVPAETRVTAALAENGLPIGEPKAFQTGQSPSAPDAMRPLAHDVLTCCPVPLKDWQQEADRVLREQAEDWNDELTRTMASLSRLGRRMYPLPFFQCLSSGPWARVERLSVDPLQFVHSRPVDAAMLSDHLCYLRRPQILWPFDPVRRLHVASLGPDPIELVIQAPSLDPPSLQGGVDGWRPAPEPPSRLWSRMARRVGRLLRLLGLRRVHARERR